jgi:alanine racemase
MSLTARATIDLAALRHNFEIARSQAPDSKVMVCVKADAYGHGLVRVAQALSDVTDAFAVARVAEAVELRGAGIEAPIVLLEGVFDAAEQAIAGDHDLTLVLHGAEQMALLEAYAGPPLSVWLKLDSGMGRLGFPAADAATLHGRLAAAPKVRGAPGLMTHLSSADVLDADTTRWQMQRFMDATEGLHGPRSIANSAGVLGWPAAHADWIRPGLMIYGASPLAGRTAADLGLRPVMRLESSLISLKALPAGARVGYGATWAAPEDMRLGLAGIGYGDGYPWRAAEKGAVVLAGQRVPVVGRVSMDMLALDLRGLPEAKVGDELVLWGPELPVEEVAAWAWTISYELLCGITRRVEFSTTG